MSSSSDDRIEQIVERVVARLVAERVLPGSVAPSHGPSPGPTASPPPLTVAGSPGGAPAVLRGRRHGVFDDPDSAVAAARRAYEQYEAMPLDTRYRVVAAMRQTTLAANQELSRAAVEETGIGRVEDKLLKNQLAAEKTPGPEFLEPVAWSGDGGLTLMERAPYGVFLSITPCTNPTETIINNAIGMVAGGNSVVFNVHPLAKKTSARFISMLDEAIVAAGGPENLLTCVAEPTIASAQALMRHAGIRIVAVTGGGEVVRAAMTCGKRAIAAGPGNPPVVVDETAHLPKAAEGIVKGASFDNNVICIDEKEVLVVADVADKLRKELERQPVKLLSSHEVRSLEKVILDKEGHVNRDFVGRNANVIYKAIGGSAPDSLRLLVCETEENHPFVQHELLMPVLPIVRVPDADAGIAMAKRVEHGFGHTASMYSTNIDNLHRMARTINTSLFVKNAPNYAGLGFGGEGYTSWTIASPTGEGLTTARTFTRERRCTLKEHFRIV